jgi:hypothetical protein
MDQARASPELAVLSVAAHGSDQGAEKIALAALGAADSLDSERGELYGDFIYLFLSDAVRVATEVLMQGNYEFKSDFARGYVAAGEAAHRHLEQRAYMLRRLLVPARQTHQEHVARPGISPPACVPDGSDAEPSPMPWQTDYTHHSRRQSAHTRTRALSLTPLGDTPLGDTQEKPPSGFIPPHSGALSLGAEKPDNAVVIHRVVK